MRHEGPGDVCPPRGGGGPEGSARPPTLPQHRRKALISYLTAALPCAIRQTAQLFNTLLGVLFQIYAPGQTPNILHPAFLSPHGVGVADFRLYSACIMAEVFSFLDELGGALALHLSLPVQSMTPSKRVGDFSDLMEAMSELAANERVAPE